LGYAAKIRPCLILNIPVQPHERSLIAYVPATTSVSNTRFEVAVNARFLKRESVFDGQQIGTWPSVKLIRKLGELAANTLEQIEAAVKEWLGLT
jgi:mRNA interferase MazF